MGGYFTGLKHFSGISNIRYGSVKNVKIIKQPVGGVIEYSDNYTFEVFARGTRPITYQWFKDNSPIVGATSSNLKLQNASQNDSGSYFCLITNLAGSVKSDIVTLQVFAPLAITLQPSPLFVKRNENAVFFIDYEGGGSPTVEWFYENKSLLTFTKSLTVFDVTELKLGQYYCIVSNAKTSITSNKVNLDLIYPIKVTKDPENVKIIPNGTLTLKCEISGAYPATFYWRKNKVEIPDTLTTLTDVNVLTCVYFEPIVNRSFVGDYDCVITNITNVSSISKTAKVVLDSTIKFDDNFITTAYIDTIQNNSTVTIDKKWVNLGQTAKKLCTGMRIYNPEINQILTDTGPIYSYTTQLPYILSSSLINSITDESTFGINTLALSTGKSIANLSTSVTINRVDVTKYTDVLTITETPYLVPGMRISGPKIPIDSKITELISPTTIRINNNTVEGGAVYDIVADIIPASNVDNCTVLKNSNTIKVPSTVGIFLGMDVVTSLFPKNTVVVRIDDFNTVIVSNVASDDGFNVTVRFASKKRMLAKTTKDSKVIVVQSTDGISVGMRVSGPNIPDGSFITKIISDTEFEIFYDATATQIDVEILIDTIISSLLVSTLTNSNILSTFNTSSLLVCAKIKSIGIPNDSIISEIINLTSFRIDKLAIANTINVDAEVSVPDTSKVSRIITNLGWSSYFDGTGYLSAGKDSDWKFLHTKNSKYTIEFWIYPTDIGTDQTLLDTNYNSSSKPGMSIILQNNGTLGFWISNGSKFIIGSKITASAPISNSSSSVSLTANTWSHVAIMWDDSLASGNLNYYINGQSAGTFNKSGTASTSDAPYTLAIGNIFGGPTPTNGWSGYFDGSSKLTLDLNIDSLHFGDGDFTIEAWVYKMKAGTSIIYCGQTDGKLAQTSSVVLYVTDTTTSSDIYIGTTNKSVKSPNPPLNTWCHVALVRSGNNLYSFLNGTIVDTNSSAGGTINPGITYGPMIGSNYNTSANVSLSGYISDLRVTKGQALYTGEFKPSTIPLTTSTNGNATGNVVNPIPSNVSLLTLQSNRFIDNSLTAKSLSIVGTPSIETFTPFSSITESNFKGYISNFRISDKLLYEGSPTFTKPSLYSKLISEKGTGYSTSLLTLQDDTFLDNSDNKYNLTLSGTPSGPRMVSNTTGTGLFAAYWDNKELTGAPSSTVIENINSDSNWGTGTFVNGGRDSFSARWKGYIKPTTTELYTFHITHDDGVRVWVNGVLIIDKWIITAPITTTGTINLTANVFYDIQVEFYENRGGEVCKLEYETPTISKQIVPSSVLYTSNFYLPAGYFDSSQSQYIEIFQRPTNLSAFAFGTEDFTIEAYIMNNLPDGGGTRIVTNRKTRDGASGTWSLNIANTGFSFNEVIVGEPNISASFNFIKNTWYHIAVTRKSGIVYLFVDGILLNSGLFDKNFNNTNYNLFIGCSPTESYYNGYISNLRIIKGKALYYISNFTPLRKSLSLDSNDYNITSPIDLDPSNVRLLAFQNETYKDRSNYNFTLSPTKVKNPSLVNVSYIDSSIETSTTSYVVDIGCTVGIIVGSEIISDILPLDTTIIEIIDYSKVRLDKLPLSGGINYNVIIRLKNPLYIDGKQYLGYPIEKQVGDNIQFSIKTTSSSTLTYQWMRTDTGSIDSETNSIYYKNDLQLFDTGEYYVVIMDVSTDQRSSVAKLNVTSEYVNIENDDYIVFDNNVYWKI